MEYLDLPRDTIYRQRQEGTGPPGYQIGKNLWSIRGRRLAGEAQGRLSLKAGDFLGVDSESKTRRQV
jgi:hypothetical protein